VRVESPFRLDDYVVDVLMRDLVAHDRSPAAFVVFVHLWRHTVGANRASVHHSHQQIADATGLSKSAVQVAIRRLVRRRLLTAKRQRRTARPEYIVHRPWAD
jgi:predicted transcriptional regulator